MHLSRRLFGMAYIVMQHSCFCDRFELIDIIQCIISVNICWKLTWLLWYPEKFILISVFEQLVIVSIGRALIRGAMNRKPQENYPALCDIWFVKPRESGEARNSNTMLNFQHWYIHITADSRWQHEIQPIITHPELFIAHLTDISMRISPSI